MVNLVSKDIQENFKFIVLEVKRQVENTLKAIESPSAKAVNSIRERDDYVNNLKSVIENKSFSRIYSVAGGDKKEVDFLRALLTITFNLEKIGDYSVSIADQIQYFENPGSYNDYDYGVFFDEILGGLGMIVRAFYKQDIKLALRICRTELNVDSAYKANFSEILEGLKHSSNAQDLVTTLFIFQYLERMGDALLNIGEAVIFSIMGEKIKIREYKALEDTLEHSGLTGLPVNTLNYNGIWGTRSGCKIGSISDNGTSVDKVNVFFKHGKVTKLRSEKENIERWESIYPGLAPKIYKFQEDKDLAALLLEYLKGHTLQAIILNAENALYKRAYSSFLDTVSEAWRLTKSRKKSNAKYVKQTFKRLGDVYRLHPKLKSQGNRIGALVIPTLEDMLEEAENIERTLESPLTVLIHGDMNSNNIIYDDESGKIHFIDLHRSKYTDFTQDVSVFMISNFRLPVFDSKARNRLNRLIKDFFRFSLKYAKDNDDSTFQARLAFGLARSFITSTRYEYRKDFAKIMYLRGVYIIEKIVSHKGAPWEEFELPEEAYVY